MESISFENKYVVTKEDLWEFYNAMAFRTPFFITVVVLYCLFLFANISEWIMGYGENLPYILSNTLCFLFIIAVLIVRNYRSIRIYFARSIELGYGQNMERVIKVENDLIIINEISGNSQHINFSQIAKCKETKHFIILMTKTKYCILFKKDSFTVGTLGEFIKFINRKYPDFKLKKSGS